MTRVTPARHVDASCRADHSLHDTRIPCVHIPQDVKPFFWGLIAVWRPTHHGNLGILNRLRAQRQLAAARLISCWARPINVQPLAVRLGQLFCITP